MALLACFGIALGGGYIFVMLLLIILYFYFAQFRLVGKGMRKKREKPLEKKMGQYLYLICVRNLKLKLSSFNKTYGKKNKKYKC